jgi:hypothetical protein
MAQLELSYSHVQPATLGVRTDIQPGVDLVQEKVFGQGPQDNENALEQAKDEQISDFVRDKWKSTTGSDVPFKDK